MNFYLILYIVVSIMFITGSFYLNYSNGKSIQAVILGIGFLLLSVVFGLRWFSNLFSAENTPITSWPPALNICPDYLVLSKVNGVPVCLDNIGVSQHGMEIWRSPDQTDEKYLFNLFLDKMGSARVSALCNECKTKGVTWEGVWDGNVCLNGEPPRPV
jgi:hypothetical protein